MDTSQNTSIPQIKVVTVTEEGLINLLLDLVPRAVHQGIKTFKEEQLHEKLLLPNETRKLFHPAISKPTLDSYAEKGYIQKHYLGGLTWYKYSEVIATLKMLKRYSQSKHL